ncbi:MAG: hypothetical protein ACOYXB_00590 [Bacteroidota bacterium]
MSKLKIFTDQKAIDEKLRQHRAINEKVNQLGAQLKEQGFSLSLDILTGVYQEGQDHIRKMIRLKLQEDLKKTGVDNSVINSTFSAKAEQITGNFSTICKELKDEFMRTGIFPDNIAIKKGKAIMPAASDFEEQYSIYLTTEKEIELYEAFKAFEAAFNKLAGILQKNELPGIQEFSGLFGANVKNYFTYKHREEKAKDSGPGTLGSGRVFRVPDGIEFEPDWFDTKQFKEALSK